MRPSGSLLFLLLLLLIITGVAGLMPDSNLLPWSVQNLFNSAGTEQSIVVPSSDTNKVFPEPADSVVFKPVND